MFEVILIALKFSSAGLYALHKGVDLARLHRAKLHIFHALDYRFKDLATDDPLLKTSVETVNQKFEEKVKPILGGMTRVAFEFFPADPAMDACRIAKTVHADLIVLGCHQSRHKVDMGRIDYVGMTILEKAPCPVMLVPYAD
jgi:nucleotide-binding universal stress UspA family protein